MKTRLTILLLCVLAALPACAADSSALLKSLGIRTDTGRLNQPPGSLSFADPAFTGFAGINDRRMKLAPRAVGSVAELRALPVPVAGTDALTAETTHYYADKVGGGNRFLWNPTSTNPDNGGTCVALASNGTNPGRYLACNYGTMEVDVTQFGALPGGDSATNRAAIQAAHDALPVPFPDPTATGRTPRVGKVVIPAGDYPISGCLYFYARVSVQGAGTLKTTLSLDPGVYTDPTHPVFVVNFELSADISSNNHFAATIDGLVINCNGNPGSSGLYLHGAQYTHIGDLGIANFGLVGADTTVQTIGSMWIVGDGHSQGPGIIITQQCTVGSLSVEHLNAARVANWQGTVNPYVVVQGQGATIDLLELEDGFSTPGENFLLLKDCQHVTVHSLTVNDTSGGTPVRITGDTRDVHVGTIYCLHPTAAVVWDDSLSGAGPQHHFQGAAETYDSEITAYDTDFVNLRQHDHLVPSETVFSVNKAPRQRLHLQFDAVYAYLFCSPTFRVTFCDGDGTAMDAEIYWDKRSNTGGQPITPHVRTLSGGGFLLLDQTETPGTDPATGLATQRYNVDLAWDGFRQGGANYTTATVTQVNTALYGWNYTTATWSSADETQANVLDGTLVSPYPAGGGGGVDGAAISPASVTTNNLTASGTSSFVGGMKLLPFLGGTWIDMPNTGLAGIGDNGAGANLWIGKAYQDGQFFGDSRAGDLLFRNTTRLLWGNDAGYAAMRLENGDLALKNSLSVGANVTASGTITTQGKTVATVPQVQAVNAASGTVPIVAGNSRVILQNPLSGLLSLVLPDPSTLAAGDHLDIIDITGCTSASHPATVELPNGDGTLSLTGPGVLRAYSDGSGTWLVVR